MRQRFYAPSEGASKAVQADKEGCDINHIINRFQRTQRLPEPIPGQRPRKPMFGDFSQLPETYHEMQNHVINIQTQFLQLPAKIRKRFHNNPSNMIQFLDDPKNKQEALDLGFLDPPPREETPLKTVIAEAIREAATPPQK